MWRLVTNKKGKTMKTFVQYINDAQVLCDPSTGLSSLSISGSRANSGRDRIWLDDLILVNGQPVTIVGVVWEPTGITLSFRPGLPDSPRSLRTAIHR